MFEFIKTLEEKFGVTAAMPMMAGPGREQLRQLRQLKKTEFNVILTGYEADKKIQVIKVVRAITSLV